MRDIGALLEHNQEWAARSRSNRKQSQCLRWTDTLCSREDSPEIRIIVVIRIGIGAQHANPCTDCKD